MKKPALLQVQCNVVVSAAFQELFHVCDMVAKVAVVYYKVVHHAPKPRQAFKGFCHAAVVMLRYRGDPVGCSKVLKPPKWGYRRCQGLALFIKGALVVPFEGVDDCKEFGIASGDVSHGLSWGK